MGLKGNLSEFGIVEVLQLLAAQGKTGVLRLYRAGTRASFTFSQGSIVSTWDRGASLADPLKTYMLRNKVLPEHQAMKVLRLEARTDLPFAELVLREGLMDLPEMARLVREQITDEVRVALDWKDGRFEFIPEPSVKAYGPGCSVKVESVLLEAVHQIDETPPAETVEPPAVPTPPAEKKAEEPPRAARKIFVHGVLLAALPVAALLLSYVVVPVAPAPAEEPVFGVRVAEFNREREVRNLRLVLEMYKTLHDRYPRSLGDLVSGGLLSGDQVTALRAHEIEYRALRAGTRYFLHSSKYGPLVRMLPTPAAGDRRLERFDTERLGDRRNGMDASTTP